jgi:hypothetical protein
MCTRRQIAEGRRSDGPITAGLQIVLRSPCARIQLVMEGIVIRARQIRQHLEAHVRRRRQRKVDRNLAGRGIRGRGQTLVAAVIRPLDRLAARGRCIAHHH